MNLLWSCGNHWEPVSIMECAVIGQAQCLAEVHGRIYSEMFMGCGRGAGLALRLCWKAFLARTH